MALTTSLHPERYDLLQQQLRSLLRANAFGSPEVRLADRPVTHALANCYSADLVCGVSREAAASNIHQGPRNEERSGSV
eukprot:5200-Heterococcus_DN1.PRE.3